MPPENPWQQRAAILAITLLSAAGAIVLPGGTSSAGARSPSARPHILSQHKSAVNVTETAAPAPGSADMIFRHPPVRAPARRHRAIRPSPAPSAARVPLPPPVPSPSPSPSPTVAQPSPVQAAGDPQSYALAQVGSAQFACLKPLWDRESGWRWDAVNPGSGAYGIPQALPGSKMAAAGADWQVNPVTQVRWGISYIGSVYGSPCAAWAHEQADGWY